MQEHHLKKISIICTIIGMTALFAITYFLDPPKVQSNFEAFNSQTIITSGKVLSQQDFGNVTQIKARLCEDKEITLFKNKKNFRNQFIELKGTVEDDQIIADEVRTS